MNLTIHTKDLIKSYKGRTVVSNVSVQVQQGATVVQQGATGVQHRCNRGATCAAGRESERERE